MESTRQLTAIIEREGDAYVALRPELDIASQGQTVETARTSLIEALELFFESVVLGLIVRGQKTSPGNGRHRASPSTIFAGTGHCGTRKNADHRHLSYAPILARKS